MINYAKGQKKKKDKGSKKIKVYPKDICNYYKEPSHWKKDFVLVVVQKDSSSENDLVLAVGEQPQ